MKYSNPKVKAMTKSFLQLMKTNLPRTLATIPWQQPTYLVSARVQFHLFRSSQNRDLVTQLEEAHFPESGHTETRLPGQISATHKARKTSKKLGNNMAHTALPPQSDSRALQVR